MNNKPNVKMDVLKKTVTRWIRHAPATPAEKMDPLVRLVRAFLEYDAEMIRAQAAEQRLVSTMTDYNELRVTPAIELAAILGVRYPFAESRCSSLHRTLQSIFEREKHMSLESLQHMHKPEVRSYLKSLAGINPYVEAAVALDCFNIPAAPTDMKVLLWLKNKQVVAEECSVLELQHVLEKNIRAGQMTKFYHGSRKDIEDWVPKVWPPVARVPSPMLAPPKDLTGISSVKAPSSGPGAAVAPAAIAEPLPPTAKRKGDTVPAAKDLEKTGDKSHAKTLVKGAVTAPENAPSHGHDKGHNKTSGKGGRGATPKHR